MLADLLLCLAQMTAPAALPVADPPNRELKIVARGPWPDVPVHAPGAGPRKRQQWALRSEKELADLAGPHGLADVARALKVERIDFDKQMLLVAADGSLPMVGVANGPPPSVPYRIEFVRVTVDEAAKVITVAWRFEPRDPAGPVITYPLAAALVPRLEGEVRFVQLPTPGQDGPKPPAPEGKEVRVQARAFWPDGWPPEMPPQRWVVRSYQELIDPRLRAPEPVLERMRQERAARYAKALGVEKVDFDRHMILGVSGGVQASPDYRVEVVKVEKEAEGKGLVVSWKVIPPRPGRPAAPGLAHPAEVVLVEQVPGPVKFQQARE
jgi:hypothetical protein